MKNDVNNGTRKVAEIIGDAYKDGSLGEGCKFTQDFNKYIKYYEIAGDLGSTNCLYDLGLLFQQGDMVEQDYERALNYYMKAAKLDCADAYLNAGVIYVNGVGVERNGKEAIRYFEKAY